MDLELWIAKYNQALELRKEGLLIREIAEHLELTESTVAGKSIFNLLH